METADRRVSSSFVWASRLRGQCLSGSILRKPGLFIAAASAWASHTEGGGASETGSHVTQ